MKLGNYPVTNDLFYLGIKALIRDKEGKVLLLRDNPNRAKSINVKKYWDFPGGRVNNRGSSQQTLKREVEEELGIKKVSIGKMIVATNANFYRELEDGVSLGMILFIYNCHISSTAKIRLSEEHDQFDWFEPKKAAKLLSIKYPKELTEYIARL